MRFRLYCARSADTLAPFPLPAALGLSSHCCWRKLLCDSRTGAADGPAHSLHYRCDAELGSSTCGRSTRLNSVLTISFCSNASTEHQHCMLHASLGTYSSVVRKKVDPAASKCPERLPHSPSSASHSHCGLSKLLPRADSDHHSRHIRQYASSACMSNCISACYMTKAITC